MSGFNYDLITNEAYFKIEEIINNSLERLKNHYSISDIKHKKDSWEFSFIGDVRVRNEKY